VEQCRPVLALGNASSLGLRMDTRSAGGLVIGIGIVIVVVGGLILTGALRWFGHLPGDIRVEREHARFYFPLVSMLVVSVVLSVFVRLARRFFAR
jgi:Protein of unknown function (DUF2905)